MKKKTQQKKKIKSDRVFEESYFEGYYRKMVGDFSLTDLEKAVNWFWGWIHFVDRYLDLKKGKGKKILEVGCSIGGAAKIFQERGFKVYASDISELAIEKAQLNLPRITFFTWDVEKKLSINEQFDVIFGFEVIEHLPDPLKALKNIRNGLKSNGKVVFSTPFPYEYVYRDPTHISVKAPHEWLKIFEKAGYSDIRLQPATFLPLLYKFSKIFSMGFPFTVNNRYFNSTLFIIAKK